MVGDNTDSSAASLSTQFSNLSDEQIDSSYFVLVGTEEGKTYSFSPRNINQSFTFFQEFKHSTVRSGQAQQTDPTKQINDIEIDMKSRTIFVAVGDEIYAQQYTVMKNTLSLPVENKAAVELSNPEPSAG